MAATGKADPYAALDGARGISEGKGMTTAARSRALGICGIIIIG